MKKHSKKIALILALALTLAIAVPVLAEETKITGNYLNGGERVISVLMLGGSQVQAFLNPNTASATLGEPNIVYKNGDDASLRLEAKGQIMTMPIGCVNLGSKVNVYAKVTSDYKINTTSDGAKTSTGNNFKFYSKIPSTKTSNNYGYVYLEAKAVSRADLGVNTLVTADGDSVVASATWDPRSVVNVLNNWSLPQSTRKALSSTQAKSRIILKSGTASCVNKMCTMTAYEGVTDEKSCFVARLAGWIGKPSSTKRWSEKDGFNTTIAWSFEMAG